MGDAGAGPGAIAGRVARLAAAGPSEVALAVDGGVDLTWGAWAGRSDAIARGLLARGLRPGDRLGLLFDGAGWADFAAAHLGVLKAAGVAVLLPVGAAAADLRRALAHSGATGLLCPPHLMPGSTPAWVAAPAELELGHDVGIEGWPVPSPSAPAEMGYPPLPLAPPRPWARAHGELLDTDERIGAGPLVHVWAPGSRAGQAAMGWLLGGGDRRVQAVARFDPDRLLGLVAAGGTAACGLTPALAAAVTAAAPAGGHDLSSVDRVLLSSPPVDGELEGRLAGVFPGAAIVVLAHSTSGNAPRSASPTPAPVAVSQEGMIWHEQFAPGSFNLPCLVRRYEGHLVVEALRQALSELVRRHQPLRTTFEMVDGVPRQVVGDAREVDLALVDLGAWDPDDRDREVARLLADATGRPFDLVAGPLFEPRLVRLGDDDHLLVVRLHHTVFDDWSVDLFRREVSALYAAALEGAPSPLVEPAIQFADVCRRQRTMLDGDGGSAQRSWWRRELAGAPLSVQLPIGDPAGPRAAPDRPGEPLRLELPPELAAQLRALAPRLRATTFMTVMAAFSVLLARTTGQLDLVIASVVAHRNRSEVEPLIGCFTKKILVRLRLDGDPTFPELVVRARTSLLGALSNQDVAFETMLADSLGGPAAAHGLVPQVAVVFQGETPQQVKVSLPGLVASRWDAAGAARAERHFSRGRDDDADVADLPVWGDGIYLGTFLILSLMETGPGLTLVARGVFHRPSAQRLLDDFQALLAELVVQPDRRVSELGITASVPTADTGREVIDLRGFRFDRARLEDALGRGPGVAEVAVGVIEDVVDGPCLVAYVVPDGDRPPTLSRLRSWLWAVLPGSPWPSRLQMVDRLPRLPDGRPDLAGLAGGARPHHQGAAPSDPTATLLSALWAASGGQPVLSDQSYWQDFTFLRVLAEARQAGLTVPDDAITRCRNPEMLAAAMAAAERSAGGAGGGG